MDRVSFVIPAYNSACWLPHAIESAQKQSYPLVEIVVVDDASTDSTPKVMGFLSGMDKRINYIRLTKNVGRSEARNIGNAHASGEIILVLDADDIAYGERAKLSVEKLKKADIIHGSCDYMDAIGSKLGTHMADVFNREKAVKEKLNRIIHSTVAYRKEVSAAVKYRAGELAELGLDDWAFQLDASFQGFKYDHIPQVIGAYRDIGTGISKTRDAKTADEAKDRFLNTLKVGA